MYDEVWHTHCTYGLESNAITGFDMGNSHTGNPKVADVTVQDLQAALTGLEFGSVVVTVHHGRIVQIERREKVRLDKNGRAHLPNKPTHAD